MAAELDAKAQGAAPSAPAADRAMVSASLTAGLTTLQGLDGRRLLLLLGGGDSGPTALPPHSLADVNVVIANLADSKAAAAWTAAGTGAGAASVKALDSALTQLQLVQLINQ